MTTAAPRAAVANIRDDLIKPLPAQRRFLNGLYAYTYNLFGGAAGPGKSHILRWGAIERLLYFASHLGLRNVRSGLFCEDYKVLEDRQISKIEREFPVWLGRLRNTHSEGLGFYLHDNYGGGILSLRNLDEPAKYASAEFADIYVDELTKNPRQTFEDLRFRLRWPGLEQPTFGAASNPGSIGHGWVKKLWVDCDYSGDEDANLDPSQFHFVPAKAGDNPYLPASYWLMLESLGTDMRRQMLEGDWDSYQGMIFDLWRRDLHVCEPFEVPREWAKYCAIDYGYSSPFGALWVAHPIDRSKVYVYRELYRAGWQAREQAKRILAAQGSEVIRKYPADPSMWQKREGAVGGTLAGEYKAAGVNLTPANNNRLAGLNAVRELMAWKRLPGTMNDPTVPIERRAYGKLVIEPQLQVFSTCTNLIRTLPSLPRDPHRPEDVDTKSDDHLYDCLRYGVMVERVPPFRRQRNIGLADLVGARN